MLLQRLTGIWLALLTAPALAASPPLHLIKLPPGFNIELYSGDVPDARSLSMSPNGTLFVGSRRAGKVYALRDDNSDGVADRVHIIASGLNMPNGVAFYNGALYIAEINQILRLDDIESHLGNPPAPVVVSADFPDDKHHGWKFIRISPDGRLYVPIGAPCNVCIEYGYAVITRLNLDGSRHEVYAEGVRNTVGFDWHPDTKELWFTDNGRDMMGDNLPADELNRAPRAGMHFGFPYCHGGDALDPEFGLGHRCKEYVPPVQQLGAHVASLGMRFYTGKMFPAQYFKQVFIAEHGSWNRSEKSGYRVSLVRLKGNRALAYETFAEGWLQGQEAWGRPVDIEHMADGSLLVSDDKAGAIYRIYYGAKSVASPTPPVAPVDTGNGTVIQEEVMPVPAPIPPQDGVTRQEAVKRQAEEPRTPPLELQERIFRARQQEQNSLPDAGQVEEQTAQPSGNPHDSAPSTDAPPPEVIEQLRQREQQEQPASDPFAPVKKHIINQ